MKSILITGSSRGIGKAIALKAAREGWKVYVHGRTDSEALDEVHAQIKDSIKLVFDVSDKNAVQEVLKDLEVDALVNNAGVAKNFLSDLDEIDYDYAVEEYKTNVLGTLECIKNLLSGLRRKQGVVVNLASIKGQYNLTTMSTLTYGATKAGVIAVTKALAKKYPEVRFLSVSPGYVETDQVSDWNEETFKRINDGTILGRIGQPEEVSDLVMFLVSDKAKYITGSDYLIDGGYSIKGK